MPAETVTPAAAAAGLQIFVKRPDSKPFRGDIEADDTTDSLMGRIQEQEGIPPDQQRLIYGGKQMELGRRLSQYNVGNEATVHLLPRLWGGMESAGSPHRGTSCQHAAFHYVLQWW